MKAKFHHPLYFFHRAIFHYVITNWLINRMQTGTVVFLISLSGTVEVKSPTHFRLYFSQFRIFAAFKTNLTPHYWPKLVNFTEIPSHTVLLQRAELTRRECVSLPSSTRLQTSLQIVIAVQLKINTKWRNVFSKLLVKINRSSIFSKYSQTIFIQLLKASWFLSFCINEINLLFNQIIHPYKIEKCTRVALNLKLIFFENVLWCLHWWLTFKYIRKCPQVLFWSCWSAAGNEKFILMWQFWG